MDYNIVPDASGTHRICTSISNRSPMVVWRGPLLSERRQVQLAVSLICTLSVVSQALQPPAGSGAFLDLLRVMGGQMRHFGAARFYSFFPFPSGDDLALYHRLLCHADCAMCWKQHLWQAVENLARVAMDRQNLYVSKESILTMSFLHACPSF